MSPSDLSTTTTQILLVASSVQLQLMVQNGENKERKRAFDTETIKVGGVEKREVIGKGGYTVSGNSVKMRDGHGDDINSTFSIVSSTVDAKFSSDGKKINYKGSGEITS